MMRLPKQRVFKLQRPLMSTQNPAPVLAYDATKEHILDVHLSKEDMATLFPDSAPKVYHFCTIEDGQLKIGDRVKDQSW